VVSKRQGGSRFVGSPDLIKGRSDVEGKHGIGNGRVAAGFAKHTPKTLAHKPHAGKRFSVVLSHGAD